VKSEALIPLFGRSAWCRAIWAIKKGAQVATPPGDRQAAYRELREQAKRHERGREENLKRILELRRERQLHMFQNRDVALGSEALD
jgi:hypothetical protein